jgi:hypothetical protein
VSMICESDGILTKPTNNNGKIAYGSSVGVRTGEEAKTGERSRTS